MFSRIRPQKVSHLIEAEIKQAIFKKQFKPGDKLPAEKDLVEMFNTSRSSIREAFRLLERSGILEIRKGAQGGAFVKKSDTSQVVDSLKDMLKLERISLEEVKAVRLILEPPLAAEAARNAGPGDLRRLEEANLALEERYKSGDPEIENNPEIHKIISEVSKNRLSALLMSALMDIHAFRMRKIKLSKQEKKKIIYHHNEIIEAIRKKDPEMASDKMKKHIRDVYRVHKKFEKHNSRD
jgi:GntR family transcriptional repressor for pyruvate dehydrogenase complex